MNLKDKTIVITGGAQGLGKAMALRLAKTGVKLALVDRNPETLEQTVQAIRALDIEVRGYTANVADEAEVEQLFAAIAGDFGAVHGLINNAGIIRDSLLIKVKDGEITGKMPLADWQSVIDVNLTGVFLCGREAATHMVRQGQGGCIINISSISRKGNIGQTNYTAAKAGVAAMSVTWAKELARYGIRVAGIAPGFIRTEMTGSMKPEVIERVEKTVPLGRMGDPDEIAGAVQFILENDYYSGRILEVDGALRL
ncbi:MAG: SDR family oxidoreductase [Gammaproteobacteria bacterium]|nr:SDR family oxidoreductase [Gammaproteobacteria bacterium]